MAHTNKRPKKRKSRANMASGLPKGAYRLPQGGYVDASGKRHKPEIIVIGRRKKKLDHEAIAKLLVRIELDRILEHERLHPDCRCEQCCRIHGRDPLVEN